MRGSIKIEPLNNVLYCPNCGGMAMHQSVIEVWNRAEDAETGTYFRVLDDHVKVTTNPVLMQQNPSSRRQGMSIWFWCEKCSLTETGLDGPPVILDIVQHKGMTILSWRPFPPTERNS